MQAGSREWSVRKVAAVIVAGRLGCQIAKWTLITVWDQR